MQKDKVAILTIFVLVLAAMAGLKFLRGGEVTTADSAEGFAKKFAGKRGAIPPAAVGEFRGFSLQLHNSDPNHPYEQYIEEIAGTGANTVCLVLTGWQENCSSTSLFIDARKTPTDRRLKELIALAHKLGLRVVLMPIVLLENPKEGEWRGKIDPPSWDDWWEDYTNYIMHYAYIAGQTQIAVMMIGSELVSTEKQADRWRNLIERVRRHYAGLVSYSANWDHYTPIEWWSDLDIAGMTTYYDLSDGKEPTVETLRQSWRAIKKDILDWQRRINRPIMFTEVGWPNQVTCAQYPWDYYRSADKPDTTAQANCFEAFFSTWIGDKVVAGYLVWEWRNSPSQKTGPEDTSYIPCGKPAMEVIKKYFQYPSPWQGRLATDGRGEATTKAVDD